MGLFDKLRGTKSSFDAQKFAEVEKNRIEDQITYLLNHDGSIEAKERLVGKAIQYTGDISNVVDRIQQWHLKDREFDRLNAIMDRYASKARGAFGGIWLNNVSKIRLALNKK